jgi:hypothetical protein
MSEQLPADGDSAVRDYLLAFAMGVGVFALLYVTAPKIGYARDEGFYFQAASSYGRWIDLLTTDPKLAIRRETVDTYFAVNPEHPSLMKLLFAVSEEQLHRKLGWISSSGQAYRVPGMFMAALATSLTVGLTARLLTRPAAVVAGLLLLTMPRWFHHAHLACFDVPVATVILLCTCSYWHAITTRRLLPALALGVFWGLALDTKHNAWWLPAVFLLHLLLAEGRSLLAANRKEQWLALRPFVCMALLGPIVLILLWPWLWYDTIPRLRFWLEFHLHHEYYNMEFLGRTYHRPPMPRGYAWLMTLATVPGTTLLLVFVGMGTSVAHAIKSYVNAHRRYGPIATSVRSKTSQTDELAVVNETVPRRWATLPPAPMDGRRSMELLLALSVLSAYAPWLSTTTPIFGGTKHWLSAYPFLCVFAARGYGLWSGKMRELFGKKRNRGSVYRWAQRFGTLALIAPAAAITWDSLPWGLSAYTPIVGGAPGAATLGLNRTFWGYTSISMVDSMRELAPKGAKLFVHDTAIQSFQQHQLDGTFPRNFTPTLDIAQSRLALYHYEPHMQRVEYQIWEAYGKTSPDAVACFDGVPVVWLYARP